MTQFWSLIKKIDNHAPRVPCRVDEAKSEEDICELWRDKYSTLLNSVVDHDANNALHDALCATEDHPIEFVTQEEVCLAAGTLSNNKSIGMDNIPAEVFKYAPVNMYSWLAQFFNECLKHCYVPSKMTDVLIVPILKSNQKSPMDSTNYRPIAIAPSISKIFEILLLSRLEDHLTSSPHQFGFKKENSTETCIFAMKEVINYYKHLNTNLYICFIDIKGAFDRVNYMKLFQKLNQRGAPKYIILLLKDWYVTQQLFVKWNRYVSDGFGMSNGIRQGSKLSPHLFNVYIDELNIILCKSKVGCHIAGTPANNFGYADDLALVAPSAKALNTLLYLCDEFAMKNDIIYSTVKSVCMRINADAHANYDPPSIFLSGSRLQYVDSFRYLGHIITNDFKDDEDIKREIKSLNIRGNILVRKFGFLPLNIKCELFRSFCYPMYTSALWARYSQCTMNRLKVSYNNIMRRLAYVPPWHSASHMFGSLGVRSFMECIRISSYSLRQRVATCSNYFINVISLSDAATLSRQRRHWHNVLCR